MDHKIDTTRLNKKNAKNRNINKRDPYTSKCVRAKEQNSQIHMLRNNGNNNANNNTIIKKKYNPRE
jgi:hypothetical protein